MLFGQHPREQGELLRSGFDCIIGPAPEGARSPVIIP